MSTAAEAPSDPADPADRASNVRPGTMRAIVLTAYGSIDNLAERVLPVPDPQPGEVLVRVHTVAANQRDLFTVHASPPGGPPPLILGIDPAGVVVATGAGVTEPSVGARVVVKPAVACGHCERCTAGEEDACESKETIGITRPGGFAEYVAVPARNAFVLPDGLTFAEASALVHSYPVALHMLRRVGIGPDDLVLVTSASGAVGSGAVQLAKAFGARVIAAAHGPAKVAVAEQLGADLVLDYERVPAFAAQVREAYPDGVSVYVESAGNPAVWSEALRTLRPHARVGVCGAHGGPYVDVDLAWLFRQRVSIVGASGSTREEVQEILALAGRGSVRAPVDLVRPMRYAREVFQRIQARGNRGKVILDATFD